MKQVPSVHYEALPQLSDSERLERVKELRAELAGRRTCRMFANTPVAREIIEEAIMAAGTAPSGANHQPWHFAVVSSPERKHQIRLAAEEEETAFYSGKAGQEWLEALEPLGTDEDKAYLDVAPWHIVVFGQRRGGLNRASGGQIIMSRKASGSHADCCLQH